MRSRQEFQEALLEACLEAIVARAEKTRRIREKRTRGYIVLVVYGVLGVITGDTPTIVASVIAYCLAAPVGKDE